MTQIKEYWFCRWPVKVWYMLRKAFFDMLSTCYEDQDFKVMSLPRLAFFVSIWLMVGSTIAEQFFGFAFSHYGELVGFVGASGASYVGKKFADRGGHPPEPPEGGAPND